MAKLPSITSMLAPDLRRFLDRVREAFNGNDPVVTQNDLIEAGSHELKNGKLEYLEPIPECTNPPAPTQFKASGAMTSIILEWEGTNYASSACHNYTEVWRSATDNFSDAILVGTSAGELFADAVGSDASFYYWVRFVNANNVLGPLNSVNGTLGTTGEDVEYLMDMLAKEYNSTSEAPFFQLDSPLVIDGETIPPGTYIRSAYIYNGQITNAKIGDAAVDTAQIANAAISEAKINNGAVTNLKIGNIIQSSDNGITWRINKEGGIYARNIVIADNNGNTIMSSGQKLDVSYVKNLGAFATLDEINASNVGTYIGGAAITNAYIGDSIQSSNFVKGVSGWRIHKDENIGAEFNNTTFRGTLNIDNGSNNKLVITNDFIQVVVNGVVRVRVGRLT